MNIIHTQGGKTDACLRALVPRVRKLGLVYRLWTWPGVDVMPLGLNRPDKVGLL
jgi:hypothetical protein